MTARTLYDKLFDQHVVRERPDGSVLLYIDRVLLHEVTASQAFSGLEAAQRQPWRLDALFAVPDHQVPTQDRSRGLAGFTDTIAREQVESLERYCERYRIPQFRLTDRRQGIVHVVGPEQGLSLPGSTLVCGDSHTSTHGALAVLAMGIGSSELEHVLATQCLLTRKARNLQVNIEGALAPGITAKDLALHVIGHLGIAGATGHAVEYTGAAVRALDMAGRFTLCNMTIEAGARTGLVAFDAVTEAYVQGRPHAPAGERWIAARDHWRRTLQSDPDARFDRRIDLDAATVAPLVTWGTKPDQVIPIDGRVPSPAQARSAVERSDWEQALAYMGLEPGQALEGLAIDQVFIGSCTNSRIEDLRAAATVIRGQRRSPSVRRVLVVPGSGLVKAQAEAEGLDEIFRAAGFEWRDAGCSMCNAMNPDQLSPGERCASTSNRNFESRQGYRGRTHLVSPAMAAAAAVAGCLVDVRQRAPA